MPHKDRIDTAGAGWLVGFALLFAANQVVIKWTNAGLQPVFYAGLRSVLAIVPVLIWMRWRGIALRIEPGTGVAGLLIGLAFTTEFLFLFLALDFTTVVRTTTLFYSMPIWLALAGHFFLPDDRVNGIKAVGLALAFGGVVWALGNRGGGGHPGLLGDAFALIGAMGWAGVAFATRATAMRRVVPEVQLLWMLVVSGVVLLGLSPLFGPLIRDLHPVHLLALLVQVIVVVAAGFIGWLWLLSVYPASGVASFGFLTPVFGVLLGWLLLDEPVSAGAVGALGLVALGLVLINRAPRRMAG